MVSVCEIRMVFIFKEEETIYDKYYANLMKHLRDEIKEKDPHSSKMIEMFYPDKHYCNGRSH